MMKRAILSAGLLASVVAAASALSLAARREDPQIAQGKYLVHQAAMCINCHGPQLQGGPLEVKPIHPIKNWTSKAPGIAGLPGWSKPAAVKFLETGLGADGKPANPPMPRYRLSAADAQAVVAYLKSLKAAAKAEHEHQHHIHH
jgi:mono/diheme cytochrome c family protein